MVNEEAQENLHKSPLYVGLTRPAMKLGVTLDYLAVTAITTLCLVILSNSLWWGILYVPLHIFGWAVCWFDPFAFTVLAKRLRFNYMPNKKIWGCFCYAPY